jgi:predicted dithiol-disulfide oxidoreductase (DUF899 family)
MNLWITCPASVSSREPLKGDVSFVAISRAPFQKLEAYRGRVGWSFKWFSSSETDFNHEFNVSFTPEEMQSGRGYYNYDYRRPPASEMVGISVFYKVENDDRFHTYSTYARGVDMVNCAYHYLDLMPKGRDEANQSYTQAWVRRHDEYGD